MVSQVAGTLIFLAFFGIVATSPDGGLDCRKFVFAPLCRGVAAKRDSSVGNYEPPGYTNEESIKELMGSVHHSNTQEDDDEENRLRKSGSKRSQIGNLLKMFQQEQKNRFLRLLFGNRRSNSEKDILPEQDFENF